MERIMYETPHYAASYTLPPSRSKYSPQHLFSNSLNLHLSLSARDQVSYPYKKQVKFMVLYLLFCKFFKSGREEKVL
jgi:hypothetical protein